MRGDAGAKVACRRCTGGGMEKHWKFCNLGLSAFALSLTCSPVNAKEALEPGASVSHKDGSGRVWCVTVVSWDRGVDGERWVWFTVNDDQRRIGHVPAVELGGLCRQQAPARPA